MSRALPDVWLLCAVAALTGCAGAELRGPSWHVYVRDEPVAVVTVDGESDAAGSVVDVQVRAEVADVTLWRRSPATLEPLRREVGGLKLRFDEKDVAEVAPLGKMLAVGRYADVEAALDHARATHRDDLALGLLATTSDQALMVVRQSAEGRRLVVRLFDELTSGKVSDDGERQAARVLRLLAQRWGPEGFIHAVAANKVKSFAASRRSIPAEGSTVRGQTARWGGAAPHQGRWEHDCGRQPPLYRRKGARAGAIHPAVDRRPARQRGSMGDDPHRPEGMAMIVIRCETGEEVEVAGDSLVGAMLAGLNLHRALLDGRDLRRADLSGADLRSAWLEGANLEQAKLTRAKLPACNASRARFVRANLTDAFMRSGIFEGADFTGADLSNADVGRSRFAGAVFDGADLRAIDLAEADLKGSRANGLTKWPAGFDPVAHGVLTR